MGDQDDSLGEGSRVLSASSEIKTDSLWSRCKEIASNLGAIRDGILVILAAVYVLGNLVWAVNSHQKHLGLLPGIQMQYFVAGFVPAVILLTSLFLVPLGNYFAQKVPKQFCTKQTILKYLVLLLLYVLISGFLIIKLPNLGWKNIFNDIISSFLGWGLFIVGRAEFYERNKDVLNTKISKSIYGIKANQTIWQYFYMSIPAVIMYITYFEQYSYQYLPQEFGGVQPRVGIIDLVSKNFDMRTRKELCDEGCTEEVFRSKKVNVYYTDNDRMLVDLPTMKDSYMYEIKKESIKGVLWNSR